MTSKFAYRPIMYSSVICVSEVYIPWRFIHAGTVHKRLRFQPKFTNMNSTTTTITADFSRSTPKGVNSYKNENVPTLPTALASQELLNDVFITKALRQQDEQHFKFPSIYPQLPRDETPGTVATAVSLLTKQNKTSLVYVNQPGRPNSRQLGQKGQPFDTNAYSLLIIV